MSVDERMKEINFWAIPLEGTPERKHLDKRLAAEREQDPEVQKKSEQPLKPHKHLFLRNKTMEAFNKFLPPTATFTLQKRKRLFTLICRPHRLHHIERNFNL